MFFILWGQSWRIGTKCDCKTDWLWVRSPLEEMKYLLKFIFPFLRSGVEAKRGVEFCHLTCNASRIRQKVGNGVSYTWFPLPILLCAGYSVKLIFLLYTIHKIQNTLNLYIDTFLLMIHNFFEKQIYLVNKIYKQED